MSIVYPLTMPTSPRPNSVVPAMAYTVSANVSPFTKKQQRYLYDGQLWSFDVSLPKMTRAEAMEWVAFGHQLRGSYGYFLMGDPSGWEPRGIATGAPKVKGAGQTGYELDTDGWTINQNGIMLKGDWFQLGTGANARLHQCVKDFDTNGAGETTLEFVPMLRTSPADNTDLIISEPMGLFSMDDSTVSWSVALGMEFGFNFTCTEYLA